MGFLVLFFIFVLEKDQITTDNTGTAQNACGSFTEFFCPSSMQTCLSAHFKETKSGASGIAGTLSGLQVMESNKERLGEFLPTELRLYSTFFLPGLMGLF